MMKLAKTLLLAAIVVGAGAAQTAELGSPMPQPAAVADYSAGAGVCSFATADSGP
jgi:hypothetical protein